MNSRSLSIYRFCHCRIWTWTNTVKENRDGTGRHLRATNLMNWNGHSKKRTIQMSSPGKKSDSTRVAFKDFYSLGGGGSGLIVSRFLEPCSLIFYYLAVLKCIFVIRSVQNKFSTSTHGYRFTNIF